MWPWQSIQFRNMNICYNCILCDRTFIIIALCERTFKTVVIQALLKIDFVALSENSVI